MIVVYILLGLFGLALLAFLLLGRGQMARSRSARLARVGRLTARLSASWLGAKIRRLFAGKERRARIDESQRKANAAAVTKTMGEMKGALMKLGQMISFVSEDIPPEYRAALASLQASAPPMDFALLADVAERELGKPLERAFARFDETPLASASIGQVHRATLPGGEEVVVKIQYPGVAEAIHSDLANVAVLYRFMALAYPNLEPGPVVEELRARIGEELDYAHEAANQERFGELYAGHPYIHVPRVHRSHSTSRVLTSEWIDGRSLQKILDDPSVDVEARSRYGEVIYRFVFTSIQRYGLFNGDPHPGNYLFEKDGRVAFLDFGCVKDFPAAMLADWKGLVRGHLSGNHEGFRKQLVTLGFLKADAPIDTDTLYEYWGYFYEPFARDREFTFSREYNAKSLRMVFAPEGKFAPISKLANMPRDFVFVNRIQWGVYSILAQLGATRNWYKIQRELLFDEPPSTEMGRVMVAGA